MHLSEFDYDLPEELIAQEPLARRDASRMLIVDRASQSWHDSQFTSLPDHLRANDVLVLNNTRVFPARLRGERARSGGAVELLLLREIEPNLWQALTRPARRLQKGARIVFGTSKLHAQVIEALEGGVRVIRFEPGYDLDSLIDQIGEPPLPPYIKREQGSAEGDRERYQTIYAAERGAIAAPTAGLHFSPEVLARLKAQGVQVVQITLHVGYGTFEPVRVDDIGSHAVAPEWFSIPDNAAQSINRARTEGCRVFAVGTTNTRQPSVRARLIDCAALSGIENHSGATAWLPMSSTRTGSNVPYPTCRVICTTCTPCAFNRASTSGLKWSPAVGAAIAPRSAA